MLIKKSFFVSLNIGGRRGRLSLQNVEFGTCADEEPVLGFCVQPTLIFLKSFLLSSQLQIHVSMLLTSLDQP